MSGILGGGKDRKGPIAKVRYVDFTAMSEKNEPESFMKTKSAGTKHATGDSGHMYCFDQRGGTSSEWMHINAGREEDAEYFERLDGFEVERLR